MNEGEEGEFLPRSHSKDDTTAEEDATSSTIHP